LIRLFSIGLFVYTLTLSISIFITPDWKDSSGFLLFILPATFFIVSILLWFFPFTAIGNLTRGFAIELDKDEELKKSDIANLLFILMGLYLLYFAISDIAYWLIYLHFNTSSDFPTEIRADEKANFGATIIELALSLFLIFGRKGIYFFINKARSGGL